MNKFKKLAYKCLIFVIKRFFKSFYEKLNVIGLIDGKLSFFSLNTVPRQFTLMLKEKYNSKYLTGVELGVKTGINSKSILKELNIKRLFLIDIWSNYNENSKQYNFSKEYEQVRKDFQNNLNVSIIKADSLTASKFFKNNSLDFIYIDANHQYEYVLKDLNAWYPKIKHNGYIGGHDIFFEKDVLNAVKNFCEVKQIRFKIKLPDFYFKKL